MSEPGPFDRIAADRLADEVAVLIANRYLDSRSAAADALLDYREPPRTERSDRIATLEGERSRLREEVEAMQSQGGPLGTSSHEIDHGWLRAVAEVLALIDSTES